MRQAASKNRFIRGLLFQRLGSGLWIAARTHQSSLQLIQAANHAQAVRDLASLQQIAHALKALPSTIAQDAGDYFYAISLKRTGRFAEADELLEPLTESPHPHFAARALQALAEMLLPQQLDEAARRNFQAARLIQQQREQDPLGILLNRWNWAIIHSLDGNHQRALQILLDLHPLLRHISLSTPAHWLDYYNSLAVELNAIGKSDAACHYINIALASPVAPRYPEWAETAQEIAAAAPQRPLLIAVQREPEQADDKPADEPATICCRRFIAAKRSLPKTCQRTAILDRIKHSMRSRDRP